MKIYTDFDLTSYNSYRLKAVCKIAYFPETDEDIRFLFKEGASDKIVLGSGHNIILSKDYYDQEFVIFSGNYNKIDLLGENMISAEAGASMLTLSEKALENNLAGLEIFYDIPSSLGGAVVMNAGASGEDIKGILQSVKYYDPFEDSFKEITTEEIKFEYRNSFFQKNPAMIVCCAILKLTAGSHNAIKQKMELIKDSRWAKQPRDYPNAGSVFKRPPGRFVGPMIEELQLKGYTIGGAKVSEKHGGFIVNFNNATGNDIVVLINNVKEKVYYTFNVNLEIEQRII